MVSKKRGIEVVLFLIFLIAMPVAFSDVQGCYVYPQASEDFFCVEGVLDTQAQGDCDLYDGCDMNEYFIPGSDCSGIDSCEEITCSSDCQLKPKSTCDQEGGVEVSDEDFAAFCSPGCCKIESAFCQFGLTQFQCQDRATRLGFDNYDVFDSRAGMSTDLCNQEYCQIEGIESASLSALVIDQNQEVVGGASVVIQNTQLRAISSGDGNFEIAGINPGSYQIVISKEGYLPFSSVINFASAEVKETRFVIEEGEAQAIVSGSVKDSNGDFLPRATIFWSGPSRGQVVTGDGGLFESPALAPGIYSFKASKIGFLSSESFEIVVGEDIIVQNFVLETAALRGIEGFTFLDNNANQVYEDGVDEKIYGARIYVDEVFVGFSKYDEDVNGLGNFRFDVLEGEHEISATYLDYELREAQGIVIDEQNQKVELVLPLELRIGECTNLAKPVELLEAKNVEGAKSLKIDWEKPCLEVVSYDLKRFKDGVLDGEPISLDPDRSEFIDTNVEWDQSYSYEIVVYYDDSRISIPTVSNVINVGNIKCDGRYHGEEIGWETFCVLGSREERKQIWTCNSRNELVLSRSCPLDSSGISFFCAQTAELNAQCKDAGACLSTSEPFGLYTSRDSCYGTSEPEDGGAINFCAYDSSDTVVNECRSCEEVESCFDYLSKDACGVNNCLPVDCEWEDSADNGEPILNYDLINLPGLVEEETGAGYCTQVGYEEEGLEENKCGLCSGGATLFENFYCSAQVCSSLGACYSNPDLSECERCQENPTPQSNCYSYQSQMECVGNSQVSKDVFGSISFSEDSCSYDVCRWVGSPNDFTQGACIKDGNADVLDDCSEFVAGDLVACRMDTKGPRTLINSGEGESGVVVSLNNPIISFVGDESFHEQIQYRSPLRSISYCLEEVGSNGKCNSDVFESQDYSLRFDQEQIEIDILESGFINQEVDGKPFKLKFYSTDRFYNQELLKEEIILVDNKPPTFSIDYNEEISADIVKFSPYLQGLDELADCTFDLKRIVPVGEVISREVGREERSKVVDFEGLSGVRFNLNVTCEDVQGNTFSKDKDFVFDLEQNIDIVSPVDLIASSEVEFEIISAVEATCSLYLSESNVKIADFVTVDNKNHKTLALGGFSQGQYGGTHKVVCRELLTEDILEDYFDFEVDFTAPVTKAVLVEGTREVRPIGFGWEEFFIENAQVSLECQEDGFACADTQYCLGEGCELINSENYVLYEAPFMVEESTKICYHSNDVGGNNRFSPTCGFIKIEGFGITLVKPQVHYYRDVQYGISNTAEFSWEFVTRVPTSECRFDFSSGFDYESLASQKVLVPFENNRYLVENFPTSVFSNFDSDGEEKQVYVKCTDHDGVIGPETMMVLEFDPTRPNILLAKAEPNLILEGVTTGLFVDTDDKTLCKYSDNSGGGGSNFYDTMEFSFEGADERILNTNHQGLYTISDVGDSGRKEFNFVTQCRNGAGDLSEPDNMLFSVDYTTLGFIIGSSLQPSGYVSTRDVTLQVQTSKNAICEFDVEDEYLQMQGAGSRSHSVALTGLDDGEYRIPVRCRMGDHEHTLPIEFNIDLSAPVIEEIDDGAFTCGANSVPVMVYTSDENVFAYAFELYDAGDVNSSQSFNPSLVGEEVVTGTLPYEISTANLVEGHRYFVRVKADDNAGNLGAFSESDGFVVTDVNSGVCVEDNSGPVFDIRTNSSCLKTYVEIGCSDLTGCRDIKYGVGSSSDGCDAINTYNGAKLEFTKSKYLCYRASDNRGYNASGSREINVGDSDGDGVSNQCDACATTNAGQISNINGCSAQDVPDNETAPSVVESLDSDLDGLPDRWEDSNNVFGCDFDKESPDSDNNGISDALEDYDDDGLTSLEEYNLGNNPCVADENLPVQVVGELIEDDGALDAIEDVFIPSSSSSKKEAGNLVAWIVLILGLLMFGGGVGYLVYFYKVVQPKLGTGGAQGGMVSGGSRGGVQADVGSVGQPQVQEKQGLFGGLANKFNELKKQRDQKVKSRKRHELFGFFDKTSKDIPHVKQAIFSKKDDHVKLNELANNYLRNKPVIDKGLRREERGVFDKLETIAKKTKDKSIKEVVTKSEAKDIFSKLKKMSKDRKK